MIWKKKIYIFLDQLHNYGIQSVASCVCRNQKRLTVVAFEGETFNEHETKTHPHAQIIQVP